MSEALVPAVTRPPAARTGSAVMALPAVIVDAGPVAVERFLEFFAASISNERTRAAYGRAVGQFLTWCAARGLGLVAIAPLQSGTRIVSPCPTAEIRPFSMTTTPSGIGGSVGLG